MLVSMSGSTGSQLSDPLDGERRLSQRSHGYAQEHQRVVVAGGAIQVQLVATPAPVHDDPLTVSTDGDRDRFHERAALGCPIAGRVVQMPAPQAVRAVVPVGGPWGVIRDVQTAMTTAERGLFVTPPAAALIA
jgi:hypothetical protein